MHNPRNQLEYGQAVMPDGRLLLIERERAPRMSRRGQIIFETGFVIAALCLPPLIGQIIPVFTFAGLWSFIPSMIVYAALVVFAHSKALSWASSPPDDPAGCKVVGMDLSADELSDIARGTTAADLVQRSVH